MCHQSVGLIARAIEAAGIPTLSMTSAWSITASANPPRAAFVDYPLGHTSGQPHDPADQRRLVRAALDCFATITEPGTIVDLGADWGSQEWRENPLRGASRTASTGGRKERAAEDGDGSGDSRTARHPTPQYQTDDDRLAAEARHGVDVACAACVGFDDW
ncbi:MAG: hypothetical protein AB7W59_10020 [Acidimicrobiia bacterium]